MKIYTNLSGEPLTGAWDNHAKVIISHEVPDEPTVKTNCYFTNVKKTTSCKSCWKNRRCEILANK